MRLLSRFSRVGSLLACVALFAPVLRAQEELPPEFLRAHAFVVRFLASSYEQAPAQPAAGPSKQAGSDAKIAGAQAEPAPSWTTSARRYTVTGATVAIRFSGDDLVIVVQVTPYDHGKDGLVVVAQGQVWTRNEGGQISYHNAFETLTLAFGESMYFFPLGVAADGKAPIKVEIAVDHYGDPPSIPETSSVGAGK